MIPARPDRPSTAFGITTSAPAALSPVNNRIQYGCQNPGTAPQFISGAERQFCPLTMMGVARFWQIHGMSSSPLGRAGTIVSLRWCWLLSIISVRFSMSIPSCFHPNIGKSVDSEAGIHSASKEQRCSIKAQR